MAGGFNQPLYVVTPNDPERLFVLEQRGPIRLIKNGTVLAAPFLDLSGKVSQSGNERGLLGLAFSPNYDQNGRFYVSYNRITDHASVIESYVVSANPDLANAASGQIVFGPIAQPFGNHNGGCIQFGPNDGYLYFGLGDGGSAGDPGCRAQRGTDLLGKMLRLDIENWPGNIIPPSNPFVGDPNVRDEIWALGLRNPWRFSFDRANGDLYTGDVGQNAWEELDYQPGTSNGGENYGWKVMEGDHCFSTSACDPGTPPCNSPLFTDPIHEYSQSGNGCSVTGGYVYRGCGIPSMQGHYFYGDFCSGRVWSFQVVNGVATDHRVRSNVFGLVQGITSFGEDHNGELLMVQRGGNIWRVDATTNTYNDLGFGTPGSNGSIPQYSICGLLLSGQSAEFRLDGAAPNQPAALAFGLSNNPTNIPGIGTLVPFPVLFAAAFMTDNDGKVRFDVLGGGGAATVYSQWGVMDNGAPNNNVALSNALEIFLQ